MRGDSNTLKRNEFLPNLILKYKLNEKQNLRLGASKTYTLPQFKERALFMYTDVMQTKIGNPELYSSQDYNLDLKWEFFPQSDELLSATAFGKYIIDPMNEVTMASATNDISYFNTGDWGYVYGIEIEARKNIFSLSEENNNKLSAGLNVSLMKTEQTLDSRKVYRETERSINLTDSKAGFTGASDLLLNADVTYTKDFKNDRSIMSTIAYSYYSDRLYSLGDQQRGNQVDKGLGQLDFILKTKLSKNLGLDFTAKNILNPTFKRVQENRTGDVTVLSYNRGAYLNLGVNYTF